VGRGCQNTSRTCASKGVIYTGVRYARPRTTVYFAADVNCAREAGTGARVRVRGRRAGISRGLSRTREQSIS
jgi:hypothetical protein